MDVALLTEGTYPYQFGGVSVWCDQLVRGMPGYDFHVVALVATGAEQCVWPLPDNVASVVAVPLWGPQPAGSRPGWRARSGFRPILAELIDVLLDPSAPAQARFGGVLRELAGYAQRESLTASFTSEEAVRLLSEAWRERGHVSAPDGSVGQDPVPPTAVPTLHDALIVLQLLEHALRPLSRPPVRADVVHAVTNGLGVLPALTATWRYGTPMLVTEHGIYLREQYLHNRRGPYRWPVKELYLTFIRRLCALGYQEAEMISPGNVYNRRWEERLGAPPAHIRTVHNGIDPADFSVVVGEPDAPTISWVGRIDPVKDLETLLHAFALVHQEMPGARLRMFGSPPQGREGYREHCRQVARRLGIGGIATFEGRVENIRDAYGAGHVVAMSSISEGLPYTVIEAMACGRACVATDVGGVSEAIGDTGVVVPPRDPEALAHGCLSLLRDADLRKRLGAAARARALELFTVDRAVTSLEEIYGLLSSGRALPAAEPRDDVLSTREPGIGVAPEPDELLPEVA